MGRVSVKALAMVMALMAAPAVAQSYDEHVAFDNARASGGYHFSKASLIAPSSFDRANGAVPIGTRVFHSPSTSLRLRWTSRTGGD
jgi:hypothetical protein